MAAELALPLIIGLVVVVIVSNALSPRVGARVALLLFIVYSVSMGLAMSCLFIAADLGSIATAFVSAAAMFGSAGVYDAVTGRSLASLRGLLSMGLGGIVIASSINLVIYARPVGELWISIAGVLALVGLTAARPSDLASRRSADDFEPRGVAGRCPRARARGRRRVPVPGLADR
jgi:FtsH-binding integral membrane protein